MHSGVDDRIAITIIAEIGTDMSVFGNAARLATWAGICPGNHESAGRQKKNKARRDNVHLKTALVTAAIGAARQKGSYYKDKDHRLKARRGPGRAAVAIAHKILVAAYNMLSTSTPFRELGEGFLDQQAGRRTIASLVRRLTLSDTASHSAQSPPEHAPFSGQSTIAAIGVRLSEKFYAEAIRLSMIRIAAGSIIASHV